MAEVASAYVSLMFSAKGAQRNIERELNKTGVASGRTASRGFAGSFMSGLKRLGPAIGAVGIGALAKQSVGLEAEFSKTMSVLQATTDASAESMKRLDALAMKMGADTAFSASDASKAMLELARGGISAAQIEAGALKGTMTLAAAGELEMGDAANYAVKAMGQFGLKGKDASAVAAALAGGANASSASVQDMGEALSQGGLAANSVGFSLQETTAILAAFSKNGLEGSDAGTSMKTMLDRLQPTTTRAEAAMRGLGIITEEGRNRFLKANGEFQSAAKIAEILRQGTEKLTKTEQKRQITQAFGSDAQRAATILAKEGAKGLAPLIKATSDQAAADKMAKANMSGTAGALERLKGAAETAELQLGKALAPTVQKIANTLADNVIPAVTGFITGMQDGTGAGGKFADAAKDIWAALKDVWDIIEPVLSFLGDNLDVVGTFAGVILTVATATKVWAGAQALLNIALTANPVGLTVVAIAALAAGFVYIYKKSETFRLGVLALTKGFLFLAEWGVRAFGFLLDAAFNTFDGILAAAEKGLGWIPGIGDKISAARDAFNDFRNATVDKLNDVANKIKEVRDGINLIPRSKTFTLNMVTVTSTQDKNALGEFGGPRASGGPVSSRKFYLVGENGPELFAPRTSGSIIPNGGPTAVGGYDAQGQVFRGVLSIDRDGVAYVDGVARSAVNDGQAATAVRTRRSSLDGVRL